MMVYLVSFTRSFEIKSSASFETLVNASSSKSNLPMVTLAIVSMSVEPMNGDKPDKLCFNCNNPINLCRMCTYGTKVIYGLLLDDEGVRRGWRKSYVCRLDNKKCVKTFEIFNLQHVANDAYAPHVSTE